MAEAASSMDHRIVVGVDGSKGARAALAWAVAEARTRRAPLEVVFAWGDLGVRIARDSDWAKAVTVDMEEEAAHQLVDQELAAVLGDAGDVEVRVTTKAGDGAELLLAVSEGADLLVVGSRWMGGFEGLLLGSVSHKCIEHARCPVLMVPAP